MFALSRRVISAQKVWERRAVIVAQLAERSLPTPEGTGSNSSIGRFYDEHCLGAHTENAKKTKIRENRSRFDH